METENIPQELDEVVMKLENKIIGLQEKKIVEQQAAITELQEKLEYWKKDSAENLWAYSQQKEIVTELCGVLEKLIEHEPRMSDVYINAKATLEKYSK